MTAENSRTDVLDPTDEGQVREFFALARAPELAPSVRVRRRVLEGRRNGSLAAGTRMPPVRRLAEILDLAPNTVAKAYKELEAVGALEGRGRAGSFVRAESADEARALRLTRRYLSDFRALGLEQAEAMAYVRRELEATE